MRRTAGASVSAFSVVCSPYPYQSLTRLPGIPFDRKVYNWIDKGQEDSWLQRGSRSDEKSRLFSTEHQL
jgi:hypothetical protein